MESYALPVPARGLASIKLFAPGLGELRHLRLQLRVLAASTRLWGLCLGFRVCGFEFGDFASCILVSAPSSRWRGGFLVGEVPLQGAIIGRAVGSYALPVPGEIDGFRLINYGAVSPEDLRACTSL